MTTDFEKSLAKVLEFEGGYRDDPNDPGGATNLGIEQSEYRAWLNDTAADVHNITRAQASAIYDANYWAPMHGDYVAWPLCFALFDCAVNEGVGTSLKFLNIALGLPVLAWGDSTSAHYHDLTQNGIERVARSIQAQREAAYQSLANANKQLLKFLPGWLNRVHEGNAFMELD
jgi:lysozyme family protein